MILLKEMAERLLATQAEIDEADAFTAKTQAAVALILVNFARVRAAALAGIAAPAAVTNAATLETARDYFYAQKANRACGRAYALMAHVHCALTGTTSRGTAADATEHRRYAAHCLGDLRGNVTFREIMDAVLA